MHKVPELRPRMLGDLVQTGLLLVQLIAERVGCPADDIAVRIFVGEVFGELISVWFTVA